MLSRRAFLAQTSAAAAANWPEFRGRGDSLGGTANLPLTWGPAKNVAWSGRLAGESWTSPVGAGDRIYYFAVTGVTEVYSAEAPPKKLAENSLAEMERTYGVAVVDDGFVLRSGRRVMRVQAS